MPMASHTRIFTILIRICPRFELLDSGYSQACSHSEAEYSYRAAVQFIAYVILNDALVNGNQPDCN